MSQSITIQMRVGGHWGATRTDAEETQRNIAAAAASRQLIGHEWVDALGMEATIAALRNGAELALVDPDRDCGVRIRMTPTPTVAEAPKMVSCDCGHTVAAGRVFRANMGTSCAACYDCMS
jgi:hypothetical protein